MEMKLKQLFFDVSNENNDYVLYQNQLKPRLIFDSTELEKLFDKHYNSIMAITEKEITSYINTENLCNDDEDMFPRKSFLTGEWYISEIYFEDIGYLSIQTAFIGTDLGHKDDYLGLDVHLYYDEETAEFIFDGIDSSAL
ncbi:MAG: hypothetical protein K2K66_02465 [Ruminococcus sp.]|nr:hypothetical protein [Ruminococcus sp.]